MMTLLTIALLIVILWGGNLFWGPRTVLYVRRPGGHVANVAEEVNAVDGVLWLFDRADRGGKGYIGNRSRPEQEVVDGELGPRTRAAIQRWEEAQKEAGLCACWALRKKGGM